MKISEMEQVKPLEGENDLFKDWCRLTSFASKMMHLASCRRGFYDEQPYPYNQEDQASVNFAAGKIALVHSEMSEALEAVRKPDRRDEHLPALDPVALEYADAIIRILDLAAYQGKAEALAECLYEKNAYNETRGYRHGGKRI